MVFQDPEDISFTTSRVTARDGLTPGSVDPTIARQPRRTPRPQHSDGVYE